MPKEAFSTEGQKKMQDAIDKVAIKDAKGIGDGMIEIFNVTATLALNQCQYYELIVNYGPAPSQTHCNYPCCPECSRPRK